MIKIVHKRAAAICGAIVLAAAALSACTSNGSTAHNTSKLQKAQQTVTNTYQQQLTNAEPYPLAQMNNSAERANLKERLLRTNNPNKIGYLYILNNLGTPIGYYTVKGKVSSTDSQMTNEEQLVSCGNNSEQCPISSMGDDGSYGNEEGGDRGIFFFTESDVMVETDSDFIYSDAPLAVKVPELITSDATPTSKTR